MKQIYFFYKFKATFDFNYILQEIQDVLTLLFLDISIPNWSLYKILLLSENLASFETRPLFKKNYCVKRPSNKILSSWTHTNIVYFQMDKTPYFAYLKSVNVSDIMINFP